MISTEKPKVVKLGFLSQHAEQQIIDIKDANIPFCSQHTTTKITSTYKTSYK